MNCQENKYLCALEEMQSLHSRGSFAAWHVENTLWFLHWEPWPLCYHIKELHSQMNRHNDENIFPEGHVSDGLLDRETIKISLSWFSNGFQIQMY